MRYFSPMDLCCLNMVIRGAWVFDKPLSDGAVMAAFIQLQKEYPFLSGRMSADGKGIKSRDVMESLIFSDDKNVTINDLITSEDFITGKIYDKITAKFPLADFKKGKCAPILAELMQIADGTVLIVQCAHVCMDGDSFYRMMARWGEICSSLQTKAAGAAEAAGTSICTGGAILDQSLAPKGSTRTKEETISLVQKRGWVHINGKKLLQIILGVISGSSKKNIRTIHLFSDEVEKLKKECGEGIGANAALSAFIVKRIMEKNGKSVEDAYRLVTVSDLRGKWNNLPEGFVGNAVVNIVTDGLHFDDSLKELASTVQANLSSTLGDPQHLDDIVKLSIDSFLHKIPYVAFDVADMGGRKPTTLYINNQLKFHPYDIDFGSGKPIMVTPNDLADVIKFWPSPDGGVEIITNYRGR